jgi:multidrug efflux pump subunit AcrB
MAASLCISFAVSWLVIPALAGPLLGRAGRKPPKALLAPAVDAPMSGAGRVYTELVEPFLRWPWLSLLIVLPLIAGGYFAYQHLETGFMPTMDEGGFAIDYVAPPGSSLTETNRLVQQVEVILRDIPEVDTYSRRTGLQLGGAITESNAGDFFVRLKPFPRRDIEEIMSEVRERVEKTIPGLEIETPQLMVDLIGDLTAVPQPVEVKLFGDDPTALVAAGPVVAEAIKGVQGLIEVKSGVVPAGDALTIEIDRTRAALEGTDSDEISKQLGDLLGGRVATSVRKGPKIVGVRAWVPARVRTNESDVLKLQVRAPDGHLFPLSRVASVKLVTGEPEITHEDLKRLVSVTGRIENRDLGSVVRDVRAIMDRPGLLPAGVTYRMGGLYQEQQQAFRGMVMVIAAAAVLVFLVLLFLYESFRVAAAILAVSALALAAVMVGLWLTGTELNVSSLMGMVMIVGNVTEVAVFLYSEFAALPQTKSRAERLATAARNRMRAITMTTVSAILALLPLAIGLSKGAGMLQPLATAIIIGLVAQLPLVLIVLPALLVPVKDRVRQVASTTVQA